MTKSKLGVIVPYRDRKEHLEKFLPTIKKVLNQQSIDYEIIIVEQVDNRPFNRGKLLNIGFKKAMELSCTYVALHDVDMLPIGADYTKVDRPTHLATKFLSQHGEVRELFDTYFGGVTLFPVKDFYQINGYSNDYWGWGYEDDDLLFRCKENFLDVNTKKIPIVTRNTVGYKFNGKDSKIEIPMPYGLNSYTILVSCEPDDMEMDESLDVDEYSILAIPGYDTGFTYNSFKRYKFQTWTSKKELVNLKSNMSQPKRTCMIATVDAYNKKVKFYQDGELVDEDTFVGRIMPYHNEDKIILGDTGSPENKRKPFKGVIDYFALWNHSLEEGQVKSLSEKLYMGVTSEFDNYVAAHTLESVYDMKFSTWNKVFDLSKRRLEADVINCERIEVNHQYDYNELPVPWRRDSTFELLPHEDNGFYENKWTYTETRKNQVRFFNKVLKGKTNWKKDGLDTLRFVKANEINKDKYHHIFADL